MAEAWRAGLAELRDAMPAAAGDAATPARHLAVAAAVRLHCLSGANVYEFYALRDRLRDASPAEHGALLARLHQVAEDELRVAAELKPLLAVEPALGFQSELYAYTYSRSLIDQKILQVRDLLELLARWQRTGVDRAVLERTVEDAERLRPDRDPDRWGD